MGLGWSDGTPACLITFPTPFYLSTDVLQTNKGGFCQQITICLVSTVQFLLFQVLQFWLLVQPDVLRDPWAVQTRWRRPGHYLWKWQGSFFITFNHLWSWNCISVAQVEVYTHMIWKWILGSGTSHQYHCSLVKTIKGFIFSRPEVQLQGLWSLE